LESGERAAREAEAYDSGIDRRGYNSWFAAGIMATAPARDRDFLRALGEVPQAGALEIGSQGFSLFRRTGIWPRTLDCINISAREIRRGMEMAAQPSVKTKPRFHQMDAHKLTLPDASFDIVYGTGILHHLELERAAAEIRRVLKPGGRMAFLEPWGLNPVGIAVRALTPGKRTKDETPFTLKHLAILRRHFVLEVRSYELFTVAASALSRLVSPRKPLLALVRPVAALDRRLSHVPGLRLLFRVVLVSGTPR